MRRPFVTEGYAATSGSVWIRRQLCGEAIRLERLLYELIPRNPELRALVALMLLHDSRRMARLGPDEEIITLEEQDRGLWDRQEIAEGVPLLESALRDGASDEYAFAGGDCGAARSCETRGGYGLSARSRGCTMLCCESAPRR